MRAPCYDTKTRTDCPRRRIGCRHTCKKWHDYERAKAAEAAQRDEERQTVAGLYEHFETVRRRKEKAAQRDRREKRK